MMTPERATEIREGLSGLDAKWGDLDGDWAEYDTESLLDFADELLLEVEAQQNMRLASGDEWE